MARKDFIEIMKDIHMSRRKFAGYLATIGMAAGVGRVFRPTAPSRADEISGAPKIALMTKDGDPIVGLVSTLAIEFFTEWNRGASLAAKALKLKWQLQVDEFDPQKSVSIMDASITAGVKLFSTMSLAPANEPLVASTAQAAGAYIIQDYNAPDFFTPFDTGPKHVAWLVPNEILSAEQNAVAVIEAAGGKGSFIHLTGLPTTPVDWRRNLGVANALAKYPEAKVVGRTNADWDRVKSQKAMSDFIVQTGGKINGVFTNNDDIALGAIAALQEQGLNVPVFGMDGVKEALSDLREGSLYATNIVFPSWIGGYDIVQIFDAANGFVRTAPERMMYWTSPVLTLKETPVSRPLSAYEDKTDKLDWELMSRVLHPKDWDPQNELYPMNPAQIWATRAKPKGWINPLQGSIDSGEFEAVRKLYADHYTRKII